MSCGCTETLRQEVIRVMNSAPDGNGYSLGTYPDCVDRHGGAYVGLQIFVVARNTGNERLFKRTQLAEASAYAKEVFGTIEALATAELCDQAVIDTYEGVSADV